MYTDIDILDINNRILQNFHDETQKLNDYKEKKPINFNYRVKSLNEAANIILKNE
jgi:hypothetical protein